MARHPIAALSDIPENGNKAFDIAGRSILVCRSAVGIFAVENMCSHAFSYLEGGKVRGAHLFCPLHGVRFDMRTGCPAGKLTDKPIATFPATVEGDTVFVEIDEA